MIDLDRNDLRIDDFRNGTPEVGVRIIHMPTGHVVSGSGTSERSVREKLIRELDQRLREDWVR